MNADTKSIDQSNHSLLDEAEKLIWALLDETHRRVRNHSARNPAQRSHRATQPLPANLANPLQPVRALRSPSEFTRIADPQHGRRFRRRNASVCQLNKQTLHKQTSASLPTAMALATKTAGPPRGP